MICYILASRFESFENELKPIIRKCEKYGFPYVYEIRGKEERLVKTLVFDERDRKDYSFNTVQEVIEVELDVQIKHNGWIALGTIVDADGIKQVYSKDVQICKQYVDWDLCICEHCHTRRNRKSCVILEHESGERKIVGTSCVLEFTKGLDGSRCSDLLAAYCGVLTEFLPNLSDCGSLDDEDCCYPTVRGFDLGREINEVVSCAAYLIYQCGFVSRSKSEITGELSTSDRIKDFFKESKDFSVLEDYDEIAQSAIDWAANLTDEQITSSYLFNLNQLCKSERIFSKHYGMAASLIPAYLKSLESKIETENPFANSDYVSEIGKRSEFNVRLVKDVTFESNYDYSTMHVYTMDFNGNCLVWITGAKLGVNVGDSFTIKGTVTKHEIYKGIKQTSLNRCKIVSK